VSDAVLAISGQRGVAAGGLAPARGTHLPLGTALRRSWAFSASSALTLFSWQPLAGGRPAEVPRPLDWDRAWLTRGWSGRRGHGLSAPGRSLAGTCSRYS